MNTPASGTTADAHYDLIIIGAGSGNSIPGPEFEDKSIAIIENSTATKKPVPRMRSMPRARRIHSIVSIPSPRG